MNFLQLTPAEFLKNEDIYRQRINDNYHLIPLLNVNPVEMFKHMQLARFQGMIQDETNSEFYLEQYEVFNKITKTKYLKSGLYAERNECKDEDLNLLSPYNVISGRYKFTAVSPPALNDWVKSIDIEKYKISPQDYRHLESVQINKHAFGARMGENVDVDPDNSNAQASGSSEEQCNNKLTLQSDDDDQQVVPTDNLPNFPLGNNFDKACQILVYEKDNKLKIGEMFEFVGFLSFELDDLEDDVGNAIENRPIPIIARVHCVTYKKIVHNNPLIPGITLDTGRVTFLKQQLLTILTQLLLGDELAAEYLLYHLTTLIYYRMNTEILGKFSINIINIPKQLQNIYCKELYKFIEMLVPKSHYLPITSETLNNFKLLPKMAHNSLRIVNETLQLGKNTHLVLDESKITGKLKTREQRIVSALSNITKSQIISCCCRFYNLDYECDIPVLAISEGRSLIPCDITIRLQPNQVNFNNFEDLTSAVSQFLQPELLNEIRVYLTEIRHRKYELDEHNLLAMQGKFYEIQESFGFEDKDFDLLFDLSRLISLSEGKLKLDFESYNRACFLEFVRRDRLRRI